MPEIQSSNFTCQLKNKWLGIEPGTHVHLALGDIQCQVYANLKNNNKCAGNLLLEIIFLTLNENFAYFLIE